MATRIFQVEDEAHAEPQAGEFLSFDLALLELKRRALIPWDSEPNVAPCTDWRSCGRRYEIVEFEVAGSRRTEVDRTAVLSVSASEVKWHHGKLGA